MISAIHWDILWSNVALVIIILYGGTILFTVFMVILENRDPVKTISWGLFIILIPGIGIIGYLIFGQNYRKVKIFSRKELVDLERISSLSRDQVDELPNQKFLENKKINGKKNIITLLLNNSKALLTQYNKVDILLMERKPLALLSKLSIMRKTIFIWSFIDGSLIILGTGLRIFLLRKPEKE